MSDLELSDTEIAPEPDQVGPVGPPSDEELRGITLFHSVDLAIVRPLLCSCPVKTLATKDILIKSGQTNHCLYVVLSGRLSVRLESAGMDPIIELGAGESVCELSVIDHQPTSAFVVAETPTRVLEIDEDLIWMLVNTSHAVSTNLLFTLVKRLRFGNQVISETNERIEQYRFHATVDALTGLFNRHWLKDHAATANAPLPTVR